MPSSINVYAGEGVERIDIAPSLTNQDDPNASLRRQQKSLRVIFPANVYPPQWEHRKTIEQAVIEAGAESNNHLVRTRTNTTTKGNKISVIGCRYSIPYNKWKKYPNLYTIDETAHPEYKGNVRIDPLINKQSGNRQGGQLKARRTVTTKLSPDQLCSFVIRLTLYPGEYWCIEAWTGNRQHKYHPELGNDEERCWISTVSKQTREDAAVFSRHTSGGGARNILQATTKITFSAGQLRDNQRKVERDIGIRPPMPQLDGDVNVGPSSGANELMMHLEKEKQNGDKSYVALYHIVKETTMLTITKADQKREKEKEQLQEGTAQMEQEQDDSTTSTVTINAHTTDAAGNTTIKKISLTKKEQLQLGSALSPIRDRLVVGQKILLAVAWVREDERRLFELFPEIFMIDITHATNSEGRPLAVSAAVDAHMKTFTPIRAFLPSECQWVFHWLWTTAVPTLLGRENIRRTQLVLSDGDPKIYTPFDSVQEELYPQAIHGLCIYHLVTQPLAKLPILRKDKCQVVSMLKTFKLWVFTWVNLGGVETEEEFQTSKNLLYEWLHVLSQGDDPEVRQNSIVLESFLSQKIIHHKKKWFLPGRRRRMTLNQKATSLLESVNQTMKYASSRKVTPNMSLLTSLKTQDDQVNLRMCELKLKVQRDLHSRPLWVNSATAPYVTMNCESMNQQQLEQSVNYACRKVHALKVEMKRLPDTTRFCDDCRPRDDYCCPKHSASSPIPVFNRIRVLEFIPTGGDGYLELRCSCLFHPTTGIPCRHVRCILQTILPRHIFIRWHKCYFVNYKRDGHEQSTESFKQHQNERRLLITKIEYENIMQAVQVNTEHWDKPASFFQSQAPSQANAKGVVPLEEEDIREVVYASQDDGDRYSFGLLSQQVGLSAYEEKEKPADNIARNLPPMDIHHSSDLFQTCKSVYSVCCNQAEHLDGVEALMRKHMAEMTRAVQEFVIQEKGKSEHFKGEYVSLCVPTDKHNVCVRKRNSAEPKSDKRKVKAKQTSFEDSLI